MANFVLYLDDSGTRPSHKVAVASALIIPATQICRLENEWNAFKKKEGFSCFHASVCNAKDKESEFADWSDEKVDRIFARVMQIAKKYGVLAISCSTHKKFYDEAVPTEMRHVYGTHHYSWCVGLTVAYAEKWRLKFHSNQPFEFIFDYMESNDPTKIEIQNVMGWCERARQEQGISGEYTQYSFRRKQDIPGLQCADEVAWMCNRIAIQQFNGVCLPQRAKACWIGYGGPLGSNGFLRAFTVMKSQLQRVVASDIADGTFEKIKRWGREDSENKNKS